MSDTNDCQLNNGYRIERNVVRSRLFFLIHAHPAQNTEGYANFNRRSKTAASSSPLQRGDSPSGSGTSALDQLYILPHGLIYKDTCL